MSPHNDPIQPLPENQNPEYASIVNIITEAAHSLGAEVHMEPEWNCIGNIVYKSGVSRYFRLSTLDLNPMGASELARDKGYARYFLHLKGYPITAGKTFFTKEWAAKIKVTNRDEESAWNYAKTIGLPVFVKPNSLSRGVGVARVTNREEFFAATKIAMKEDRVFLVEKELIGKDYRLVVLDGEVISAYERIPLHVIGDGYSTLGQLIDEKDKYFQERGRNTIVNVQDSRLLANMKRMGLRFENVVENGRRINLLDNANLSTGGESVDVTNIVHDGFKELASKVAFDMGLRLLGLDLIIDGSIDHNPEKGKYFVLEINSAPGLDHYASMGYKQRQIVFGLYLRVIAAMERANEIILVKDHK